MRLSEAKGTKEKEGEECDLGRKLPLLSLVVSKQGANTSLKERAPNVGLAPLRDTRTPHNRLPRFRWALLSLCLPLLSLGYLSLVHSNTRPAASLDFVISKMVFQREKKKWSEERTLAFKRKGKQKKFVCSMSKNISYLLVY